MATYDAEFLQAIAPMMKAQAAHPIAAPGNSYEIRAQGAQMMEALLTGPFPEGVTETRIDVPAEGGPDGGHAVTVAVYRFATAEQLARRDLQPAVIYLHGGGMVAGKVRLYAAALARQTVEVGVQHFAVDYRLAPDASAAQMLEECYGALAYVSAQAAALGVDAARIGIAGESAGGGLAVGTALLARDRGLHPPLAKLIAIYPMLDDRTVQRHPPAGARHPGANTADEAWAKRPALVWTPDQNAIAWAAYLGVGRPGIDGPLEAAAALAAATTTTTTTTTDTDQDQDQDPDALPPPSITPYSVPSRAASLAGLPSTYLDVGTLDLFAEEDALFAARLVRDDVDVDFHLLRGLPHAYDMLAPNVTACKTARQLQIRAYNSF